MARRKPAALAGRNHRTTAQPSALSAAEYLRRLQLVMGVLAQLHRPDEVAELAVQQCARALGASSGLLSLARESDNVELVTSVGYAPDDLASWRSLPLSARLPLPDVVRSGHARFFEHPAALLAHYPELAAARLTNAAWAILPLPVDERVLGAIVLSFDAPRRFSGDERAFLLALAQHCAQTLERVRLYDAARDAARRAEQSRAHALLVADVSRTFANAQLDLDIVLAQITRQIGEAIGDGCSVRLLSEDRQLLLPSAFYRPEALARQLLTGLDAQPYPVGVGLIGQVAASGQPLFLPEVDPAEVLARTNPAYRSYLEQFPVYGLMVVPLRVRDRVIGTLSLSRSTPGRPYAEADMKVLGELADRAALAIDNAQLYQQAQRHSQRIALLADASRVFAEAQLDPATLLPRVATYVAGVLGDQCTIRLLSGDGQRLDLAALYHPRPEARALLERLAAAEEHRVDQGLTGQVFRSGQPLLLPSVDERQLRAALKPIYLPYLDQIGIASILVVLLRVGGRIIGTLFLSRDAGGRTYTAEDQSFLQELADRAAVAIEHARLYLAEQRSRAMAERAAARTAVLQSVTSALSHPHTPEGVVDIVVQQGIAALGGSAGTVSLLNDDGSFSIIRMVGYPPGVAADWVGRRYPATLPAPIPDVVRSRAPLWLEHTEAILERYPHLAAQLGDRGRGAWAAVPLMLEDRAFGGLTLLFDAPRQFSDNDRAFILALAQQCTQAIERARLHAAEQQAQREVELTRQRQAILAEVSADLAASLDVQTTLETLARAVVPRLADWCVVDWLDEDGSIRTVALAHSDPAREALGWQLVRRYSVDPQAPGGTAAVLRTRRPELIAEITDELLDLISLNAEHRQMLADLGVRSSLCVPLVARGRALGTIALIGAETGRRYSEADLPFVEDLARRAALAVDNARLYQQAQDAVRLRDTFFSVAAHELRTPLTSLLGQAQLLHRRATRSGGLDPQVGHSALVIASQASRLNRMIVAMLDSARLERGQLSIERQPVDLCALLARVVEEMLPTLERHTLNVRTPGAPLVITGDWLRLEQVAQNIIGNAIKYSPDGGPVDVRLERDGGAAVLSVQDCGVGIPERALPHLFERFYRADNISSQHISGMGIGLYVVREIVELHGGSVAVESHEGQGTTFVVRLPLAEV